MMAYPLTRPIAWYLCMYEYEQSCRYQRVGIRS